MKVFVYFNLIRKLWSIKALEGKQKGLVIGHAKGVCLTKVIPKVNESGRQRVLREKQKNVHAGLVGDLLFVTNDCELTEYHDDFIEVVAVGESFSEASEEITYNPYKYTTFVVKNDTERKMVFSGMVVFLNRRVYCCGLEVENENQAD